MPSYDPRPVANIGELIRHFGGTNRLAGELGVAPSAISAWVSANAIPERWHARILILCLREHIAWRPPYWDPRAQMRWNEAAKGSVAA